MTSIITLNPSAPSQRMRNTIRSEVDKLRSVRSTAWTIAVTLIGALAITTISAEHIAGQHHPFFQFDSTNMALNGAAIASLALGVLGILAISGEYSSGTIRASLSATPNRLRFLLAKVAVVGVLALVVSEVLTFSCFFLGMDIIRGSRVHTASLGQPGVLRAVVLTGAFLAVLAVFAVGIGLIIRHTAGALATFVGVTLLLPILLNQLGASVTRFSPELMLGNSVSAVNVQSNFLSPTWSFILMCGYAAVTLAIGATLLNRRDA
jgi:ABC-2 type transport system permease protein